VPKNLVRLCENIPPGFISIVRDSGSGSQVWYRQSVSISVFGQTPYSHLVLLCNVWQVCYLVSCCQKLLTMTRNFKDHPPWGDCSFFASRHWKAVQWSSVTAVIITTLCACQPFASIFAILVTWSVQQRCHYGMFAKSLFLLKYCHM